MHQYDNPTENFFFESAPVEVISLVDADELEAERVRSLKLEQADSQAFIVG